MGGKRGEIISPCLPQVVPGQCEERGATAEQSVQLRVIRVIVVQAVMPRAPSYSRLARGTVRVNVDPFPTSLSTVTSPPMRRARSRLIVRPNPAPVAVRV